MYSPQEAFRRHSPKGGFKNFVRRRRHPGALLGGGIAEYCPPEEGFRGIVQRRRDLKGDV